MNASLAQSIKHSVQHYDQKIVNIIFLFSIHSQNKNFAQGEVTPAEVMTHRRHFGLKQIRLQVSFRVKCTAIYGGYRRKFRPDLYLCPFFETRATKALVRQQPAGPAGDGETKVMSMK